MPITQKMLPALIGNASQESIAAGNNGAQQGLAKLKDMLAAQSQQREIDQAKALQEYFKKNMPGQKINTKVGDISISQADSPVAINLTPAQDAAEKVAGKDLATYLAAGGRPAIEKNLEQVGTVKQELDSGQRGLYDRLTGAAFGSMPGVLGLVSSSEKSRRDRARNAAIMIARATDPNPTEKQVENIFGQIYDPASSNEDNQQRINRFLEEQRKTADQKEAAANQYLSTGYATLKPQLPKAKQVKSSGFDPDAYLKGK